MVFGMVLKVLLLECLSLALELILDLLAFIAPLFSKDQS